MQANYKPRFPTKIEDGTKIHTFRQRRKRRAKIGEQIHQFTGLRTKNCRRILGKYFLKSIQPVRMIITRRINMPPVIDIHIGDKRTWNIFEINSMAVNDGFKHIYDFMEYWLDGNDKIAFSGECYHWTDLRY